MKRRHITFAQSWLLIAMVSIAILALNCFTPPPKRDADGRWTGVTTLTSTLIPERYLHLVGYCGIVTAFGLLLALGFVSVPRSERMARLSGTPDAPYWAELAELKKQGKLSGIAQAPNQCSTRAHTDASELSRVQSWRKNLRFAVGAISVFSAAMSFVFSFVEFEDENLAPRCMLAAACMSLISGLIWYQLCNRKIGRADVPNQLPDPTSPSVTPPAGAGGAPSVAADH